MEHDTRVELAATGAHRQPVERRKPHRRGYRNASWHCACGTAIAEMRHDDSAMAIFGARSGNTEAMYS